MQNTYFVHIIMSVAADIKILRDDLRQFYNTYDNFNRFMKWEDYYQTNKFENELESSDEDLSDWEDDWMDSSEDDNVCAYKDCKRMVEYNPKWESFKTKKMKKGDSCFNPIVIDPNFT